MSVDLGRAAGVTPAGLHDLIRQQAGRNSAAPVIFSPRHTPLTYRRLWLLVNEVAEVLNSLGIGRNDRVAAVLPEGPEAAVASLAIACAATYAPINPAYGAGEFERYFADLNPRALLVAAGSSSAARHVAETRNIPILELFAPGEAYAGAFTIRGKRTDGPVQRGPAQPNDVALVLYTSGTTGQQKLVSLTHKNICCSANNICDAVKLVETDRCLSVMPLFHIHGLSAVFASLVAGSGIVCPQNFSSSLFLEYLEEFRPTWYTAAPTIHRAILESANIHREIVSRSSLRFIRSASSPMPQKLISDLERVFDVPVIEAYGMTEAGPQIASNRLPPFQRRQGSVGLSAGPEVAIADEAGQRKPTGEIGEVIIRGPNVTNAFEGNGWLRTGDLGYLDADGYLFITGRIREMVNRGGEKISPREVDEALMEHPAVLEAVSFAVPHATLGESVGAAVVLRENARVTEAEIRKFAATRLAHFKIPGHLAIVTDIPKGPGGKVQRIGMVERLGITVPGGMSQGEIVAEDGPRTRVEEQLVRIFADVLGLERIGIRDDFFHSGGHSLLSTQVVSRVMQEFDISLPMESVFAQPTVIELGERISRLVSEKASASDETLIDRQVTDSNATIPRRGSSEACPLSFAQQRLWFLDQMEPGNPAYNMHAKLRIGGPLSVVILGQSLTEILRRHEALRTTYHATEALPVQRISQAKAFRLPVIDLSDLPTHEQELEIQRLDVEEARLPFHLSRGPLFRAVLLRLGADDHVLLLTMHHVVSDGWSMGVLYRELGTLYTSLSKDAAVPLPELPIQYADYALWQRQWLEGERLKKGLEYWRKQLSDRPPSLALPGDRPRPSDQAYQGARVHRTTSAPLTESLRRVSREEQSTPFMLLLAAFQTLLLRYSGQEDILVGTPIANRTRVETEKLIGFFANTLVMRTDLSGDPTFREALQRVRATALEAFAHQDVPFEKLVEELGPERSANQVPLFQVMFAFQNVSVLPPELGRDLNVRVLEVDSEVAKFDLTLYLSESAQGLKGTWQYNSDLFESATIERMAAHFEMLLDGIATNPSLHLSELPLLTDAERRQLLIEWNPVTATTPSDRSVRQLIEEQVRRTPDAPAVQCGNVRLTYAELNHRADQLAHRLHSMGTKRDTLVGICLTRSVNAAIALLGVLKAGCVYLPMDPEDPAERLAFILEDARVAVLVTEEELQSKLPSYCGSTVFLESNPATTPEGHQSNFTDGTATDLAYVIYTSGSTGKPKGVMITQANLSGYVRSLRDTLEITSRDRWLHTASLGFSSSIRQFLVPLSCGATVVVATVEQIRDPWAMFELIRHDRVSILDLVPSHLRTCIRALTQLDRESQTALLQNALRLVLSASEPLASDIPRGWVRLLGNRAKMINMFGQTETSGIVTVYPIPHNPDAERGVPIGRPISNSTVYLLDAFQRPVPIGARGEVYVGGSCVGAGYLNQPELTAARFIPDPFSTRMTARLYRTGDQARFLPDGNIEFLGRSDHQIKVRGFRIEPGEIETVLGQHPLVRECAVIPVSGPGGQRLVAHVVAARDSAEFIQELREYAKAKLPQYMVPAAFVELENLPRMSNGKVNRQTLSLPPATNTAGNRPLDAFPAVSRTPAEGQPDVDAGFVSPSTHAERTLAKIWGEVLGVERVGVHDNFFDLGGDSLLTTHVVQKARDAGLSLRIAQVFRHQTIAQLARAATLNSEPVTVPGPERKAGVVHERKPVFRVTVESLRAYGCEALEKAGLPPEGAAIVTEVQLEASLRSQPTHNMGSIPRYARRNASGRTNPQPRFRIERETAVSALVDGDNGQGQWVAVWAMQLAIRKAKESGIAIVGARRSNHFGAAGHYAWLAAKENLIGLATSNAGVWLAPTGGLTPTFGNNPLGVGIPAMRNPSIVMDISMSVAAKGKIGLHLADGNPLPMGWIFDRFGRLSIDPSDLAAGLGVPMGGHKGYGLTVVLETLAGILTGAGFCRDHRRERMRQGPPDLGHLFMAINPELFMPIAEFKSRVDSMVEQVKSGERAENVSELLLPGEMEMRARSENLIEGVPILSVTYSALEKYRKTAGLTSGLEIRSVRTR